MSEEIINKSLIYIYKDYDNKKDKEGKQHISNIDSKLNELKNENENQKENIMKLLEINSAKDKEIERLNNALKDIKSQLNYLETYSSKEDVFDDMKRRLDNIEKIVKGSDKE